VPSKRRKKKKKKKKKKKRKENKGKEKNKKNKKYIHLFENCKNICEYGCKYGNYRRVHGAEAF
jgi:2-iminoacetate synthase ThiH